MPYPSCLNEPCAVFECGDRDGVLVEYGDESRAQCSSFFSFFKRMIVVFSVRFMDGMQTL